jgi:hypothetical protein
MTVEPGRSSRTIWRWINLPAVLLLVAYRATLSPLLGGHCRFVPTCSVYALEAYRTRNPLYASYLTAKRLLRCHPFGGSGYDPVPPGAGETERGIGNDEDRNGAIS